MAQRLIKSLFAKNIERSIEEVIKVDQTDEEIIRDEIDEYVVTDSIRAHFTNVLEAYREIAVAVRAAYTAHLGQPP